MRSSSTPVLAGKKQKEKEENVEALSWGLRGPCSWGQSIGVAQQCLKTYWSKSKFLAISFYVTSNFF